MLGKLWAVWLALGSLSAASGVLLAAAGSHIFKNSLTDETLRWFTHANQMQLYHSTALVVVALLAQRIDSNLAHAAGGFFLLGMLLFPVTLYMAAIKDMRELLFLAPYGGISFVLGWLLLVIVGVQVLLRN